MTPEESKKVKDTITKTLSRYKNDKGMLVSILQDVQKELYYLPEEALKEVSYGLEVPVSRVYSVATFFKAFALKPRGRHVINVCLGTACHVRGAIKVLDSIERKLGIKPGGTTGDFKYTLETVNCLGACALGPIVVIDGKYHGEMSTGKVDALLDDYA
jgi:NADH-quinone oxidoreductase subunit E